MIKQNHKQERRSYIKDAVSNVNGSLFTYSIDVLHGSGKATPDKFATSYKAILEINGTSLDIGIMLSLGDIIYFDKLQDIRSKDIDNFIKRMVEEYIAR